MRACVRACAYDLACLHVFAGKPELRTEVDIIVADVEEPDSLAAMCKQAVIVLNCVGPVSREFRRNVCACVNFS